MISPRAFELLSDLAANNTREWYHEHKAEFEAQVLGPFADALQAISDTLIGTKIELSGGGHTMFRMNRDVRFSKDKSPYKTSVSGLLTPSGTKSEEAGLVYLCMDAAGGFVAGGYHNPDPKMLGKMRDRIISRPTEYAEMIGHLSAHEFELEHEGALKRMPRGFEDYAEADSAGALKLKQFIIRQDLEQADWESGKVVEGAAKFAETIRPLIEFFQKF